MTIAFDFGARLADDKSAAVLIKVLRFNDFISGLFLDKVAFVYKQRKNIKNSMIKN
jgi:hypothetical protein